MHRNSNQLEQSKRVLMMKLVDKFQLNESRWLGSQVTGNDPVMHCLAYDTSSSNG